MTMGFRRYVAPSAREALERIRKELGPESVILSNRRAGTGRVEIIAAAPGEMRALVDEFEPVDAHDHASPAKRPASERTSTTAARRAAPESFQEFIRRQSTLPSARIEGVAMYNAVAQEGGLGPIAEKLPLAGQTKPPVAGREASAPAVFRRRPSRQLEPQSRVVAMPETLATRHAVASLPSSNYLPSALREATRPAEQLVEVPVAEATKAAKAVAPRAAETNADNGSQPAAARARAPASEPITVEPAVNPKPPAAPKVEPPKPEPGPASAAVLPDARVMAELQSLRSVLSDRISNLETKLASKATPAMQTAADPGLPALARQAMTRLLMSGFSPQLARRVSEAVPATLDPKETDAWLQGIIAQRIRCPADAENPIMAPGAAALVGPTGVGKTTTIAKLAARFVVRHGAGALGLVTLDSYRIGAHEQLRSYGRILGVPVHSAHDAASLRDLLNSLHGKRQVLIDTCGMSQRDQRLTEMLAMLDSVRFADREIQRVLLINAASHAETLDEVARAWRVESVHGAVLTKIDEAARIGGALDAMMRYHTALLGLTNGQRVPEDWHPGNPPLLAHIALKPFGSAFCLDSREIQALSSSGALLA